ncbi:hypothetical protein FCH28_00720 [Streptomyces piniterrae]|uniref:Secreted protein n=1 Tax=Streptomyces piniterrae TaxID=2571125 RepID=A0A4U0NVJ7_9ACTN|nr:hypothetical protein [Streptomyces piniterrae]TJZ58731.1 hypothetical protein FCH28_00720 [Streptomyces piniterrae]
MSRKRRVGKGTKIALVASAASLVGGIAIVTTGTSQASAACDGLATALSNNQKFIAEQQANPDAQSAARIANRQAVIKQIEVQQKAAGCASDGGGGGGAAEDGGGGGAEEGGGGGAEEGGDANAEAPPAAGDQAPGSGSDADAGSDAGSGSGSAAPSGDVVCPGSTVTLSGEGGAPAASSGEFPAGTKLKVTNLDNDKSTTVEVTSTSGSCVLLNNAAFEEVREAGKFLIRNARIERVG